MKLKGIAYPIVKEILLRKGDLLYMASDENKFWIEAGERRITEQRKGNSDPYNSSILWLNRAKND